MSVDVLALPSGCAVKDPLQRMMDFCRKEYIYYDGIPSAQPDRIEPIDVLVTVSMNSFVNTATKVRDIHQGLSTACDAPLSGIPAEADLLSFDQELSVVRNLFDVACRVRGVLLPVATKVLHRKRRSLIPMLDKEILKYYLHTSKKDYLLARAEDGKLAADVGIVVLRDFRSDLRSQWSAISELRNSLNEMHFDMSAVRILEVLIWTEVEPQGYYRR